MNDYYFYNFCKILVIDRKYSPNLLHITFVMKRSNLNISNYVCILYDWWLGCYIYRRVKVNSFNALATTAAQTYTRSLPNLNVYHNYATTTMACAV